MKGLTEGQNVFLVNVSKAIIVPGIFKGWFEHELKGYVGNYLENQAHFMVKPDKKSVKLIFDKTGFYNKTINPKITNGKDGENNVYKFSVSSRNCNNNTYLVFTDEVKAKEALKTFVIPLHIERAELEAEGFQSQYMERIKQIENLQKIAEAL